MPRGHLDRVAIGFVDGQRYLSPRRQLQAEGAVRVALGVAEQAAVGAARAQRRVAARLEEVHAPLEDRLSAYEQRIAELEAELAAKGEQNLDLIKAKIETTRKQMEGERSQERLDWN